MVFTPSDVRRIARLARLRLADDDSARIARQLDDVVAWVECLDQVVLVDSGDNVPDTAALDTLDPAREADDAPASALDGRPRLDPAGALDRAPATRDGFVLVPGS